MSRAVSNAFLRAVFARETDEVFLTLLKIEHENLSDAIRVVNNDQNIVSNGEEYIALAFEIELPGEADDALPMPKLSIDNVDRMIVKAIREIDTPATVTVSVILASDRDVVEAGPFFLTLRETPYDPLKVEGTLYGDDILNEAYPGHLFTPGMFPGLF